MQPPSILAVSGSMREASLNTRLVRIAAEGAREAGAAVTVLELREHPLPVYDGDLEAAEGLPEQARELKRIFGEHHGLLIASPENNSAYSAALKNAIDWVSRKASPDEPALRDLSGKVAGIMAASPGAMGGFRGLYPLRMLLEQINIIVLPQQRAISKAHEAFDADGNLKDEKDQSAVMSIGRSVAETVVRLKS